GIEAGGKTPFDGSARVPGPGGSSVTTPTAATPADPQQSGPALRFTEVHPQDGAWVKGPEVSVSCSLSRTPSSVRANQSNLSRRGDAYHGTISLTDGPGKITFEAVGDPGSPTSHTVEVVVDSVAPVIKIEQPTKEELRRPTQKGKLEVKGRVDDANLDSLSTGDDQRVRIDEDGRFSFPWSLGQKGKNTLTLTAVDRAANMGEATLTIVKRARQQHLKPGPGPGEFTWLKDSSVMVRIPEGPFTMGNDFSGSDDEKPSHSVVLKEFYIDRHEVTVAQFKAFTKATGYVTDAEKDPQNARARGNWRNPGFPQTDTHPVAFVSWNDGSMYAKWIDKRLPTEAEWEKAASWDAEMEEKWLHIVTSDAIGSGPRVANVLDLSAAHAGIRPERAVLRGYDDGFPHTAPVASYPDWESPYGCRDMAGNVFEWCADWYSEGYYRDPSANSNPRGPARGTVRVVRGSAWDSKIGLLATFRGNLEPERSTRSHGFRCAFSE
ncbi:SUMF1/EgtB/PvdO family nonheme iron enzyme, partial [Planctomycetota bacterium]